MDYILVLLLGIVIGYIICIVRVVGVLRELLDKEEKKEIKPKVKIPIYEAEEHGDVLLLYEENKFMCQGTSLADLASNLFKHNNIKLAVIRLDNHGFVIVDGVIKKEVVYEGQYRKI